MDDVQGSGGGQARDMPWRFLLGALLVAAVAAGVLVEAEAVELEQRAARKGPHMLEQAAALRGMAWRMVLGMAPLLAGVLALFHPACVSALRRWRTGRVAFLAAGLCVWAQLWCAAPGFWSAARVDLYLPVILGGVAFAAVCAGRDVGEGKSLAGTALAVWLLLWIPFDLRWYRELWFGLQGSYAVFSQMVVLVAGLSFAVVGLRDDVGLRAPQAGDVGHGLLWLVAFGALAVPIGLAVGFLEAGVASTGLAEAGLAFVGLALTVALPEELFFRGILDRGLQGVMRRPWASLALSSFLFGLMHWNNASSLGSKVAYVGLATLAGVFYGLCFRRSGGLVAPVLTHTLVDLVWAVWLKS